MRAQTLAVYKRHGVIRHTTGVARAQHRNDVRLLERRGELDLALEALGADPLRELGRQDLHNDLSSEARFVGHEHA